MLQFAEAELDRIGGAFDQLNERYINLMDSSNRLQLERNYLQLELEHIYAGSAHQYSQRLGRIVWGLRRSLAPVHSVRQRAQAALVRHKLDLEAGMSRLVFDPDWYRLQLDEAGVEQVRMGATALFRHYILSGEASGFQPTRLLVPRYYAQQIEGLVPGKARVLLHFLEHGMHLATPPRPGLEDLALRALAERSLPSAWLFSNAETFV
jgi:hypothetical protein